MNLALNQFPVGDLNFPVLSVLVVLGLLALTGGGQLLMRGAVGISANLKIDPLIVGLTVVSIATSTPEFFTALIAAEAHPGLAMGNILGSNLANTGLILGIAALIVPLKVNLRLIRLEVPILIFVTLIFGGLIFYKALDWGGGLLLLLITIGYLVFIVNKARQENWSPPRNFPNVAIATFTAVVFVIIGSLLLASGADLLVQSSAEIAARFGVSDVFIGLTIMAIGTSLPELAACIAAVRAGQGDLCAGNIVGSNLFNLLLIGGGTALIKGLPVEVEAVKMLYFATLLLTFSLFWFFRSEHTVSRREGGLLLFFYLAFLILVASQQ
ncbi:MAG: Inner membrane protein YrbG [Opitutia bacterium UBA7350]|nr:MAG: Inner membrane protein YrbG [Opitutae bacterium UBA7350]